MRTEVGFLVGSAALDAGLGLEYEWLDLAALVMGRDGGRPMMFGSVALKFCVRRLREAHSG